MCSRPATGLEESPGLQIGRASTCKVDVGQAIIKNAPRPYGAILFIEFLAGPEAQKILDDIEPLKSSIYVPDSELQKVTQGKKVAVMDTFEQTERWVKK